MCVCVFVCVCVRLCVFVCVCVHAGVLDRAQVECMEASWVDKQFSGKMFFVSSIFE